MARTLIALAVTVTLAACGAPKDEGTADSSATTSEAPIAETAAAPASGAVPAIFAQCQACHSVEKGKNGVGPSLFGVVGRKAGTVEGFAYSDANKDSGRTWDEATLDKYLTAPMKMVPGTKMVFAGVPDAAKRQDLIAYLKTLK